VGRRTCGAAVGATPTPYWRPITDIIGAADPRICGHRRLLSNYLDFSQTHFGEDLPLNEPSPADALSGPKSRFKEGTVVTHRNLYAMKRKNVENLKDEALNV